MTIVLTGGGSGGHITPILAIALELKRLKPDIRIVYIGQKGDKLADLPQQDPNIDLVLSVRAGKLRRYHGEGLKQLLDIKTVLKNVRDSVFVCIGFFQSWFILRRIKPDCVFVKGGFVGVPVGLAAATLKIPYVTHDSDALPGLANRIIARWAKVHAVALPKEVYKYPPNKTATVGVPIHENYQPVTAAIKAKYRSEIGLSRFRKVILVTGGGLGARRLNEAVVAIMPSLLKKNTDMAVIHTVGRGNETSTNKMYQRNPSSADLSKIVVEGYLTDLFRYSAASDVIIARAGATNLAEFANQGKPCIIVPNPQLTGGHQLKNAAYLAEQEAIEVVTEQEIEKDSSRFEVVIQKLLDDETLRSKLSKNLAAFANPNSATQLAELLINQMSSKA